MNHYNLSIKVVTTLKQPWFGWEMILWCQLINVLLFGLNKSLVCQVKYLNGFDPIWNNAPWDCLFVVFYLMFSFCYQMYHKIKFLVLWFLTVYTRLLRVIAQRYGIKYHLYTDDTQLYMSLDPDNQLNFSSSLNNLEHYIADIRLKIF